MVSEDVLREILYKLPLDEVNYCKSVSKEWNSLISDPEFDHDKRRVMGDNALFTSYTYSKESPIEAYDIRCCDSKQAMTDRLQNVLGNISDDGSIFVLGSYNGLVGMLYDERNYILWNPVTEKYTIYDGNTVMVVDPEAVGLCHDASKNEYFAVVVGTLSVKDSVRNMIYVQLINFTTNNSTDVPLKDELDEVINFNGVGTTVCGVPHWVKELKNVVYFDSKTNQFKVMVLPDHQEGQEKSVLGLGALNGQRQLGIVLQETENPQSSSCEVWVMKDYGKPESWTYLCKLPSSVPNLSIKDNDYGYVHLLGLKPKTGEVWIGVQHDQTLSAYQRKELMLLAYDTTTQQVQSVGKVAPCEGKVITVTSYEPTLISPPYYHLASTTEAPENVQFKEVDNMMIIHKSSRPCLQVLLFLCIFLFLFLFFLMIGKKFPM